MRERWNDFKAMLRELFNPRWVDDEPDTTTLEQIARWVDGHRHPPEAS